MIIEREDHRQFILEAIKNAMIPGSLIDLAHEVKLAVETATLPEDAAQEMLAAR